MTRISLILAALLLLASPLSLFAAAEVPTQKAAETGDKEQYEKSMQERLGKLGAKLDELKKKADADSARAEKQLKAHLAEAEKKRQIAAKKLEELGQASRDSWKKFSAEMDKAAKEFERAYEQAVKHKE
jgi:hypothetical protein